MASQIFNLGKLRFTYKGTYSSSTEYVLNDVVKYGNSVYVFTNAAAATNVLPTNTSFWTAMIEGTLDPTTGSNGQFLQTNGSSFLFATVSQVPSQTGNSGKILTTNGTSSSWTNSPSLVSLITSGDVSVGDELTVNAIAYLGANAKATAAGIGTNVVVPSFKSRAAGVATITTSTPHGFAPFQQIEVALNPSDPIFDGIIEIISVPSSTQFTYTVAAGVLTSTATSGFVSALPGFTNLMAYSVIDADDDYAQFAIQNLGNGVNSSTDFIAYANNGTDFAGYVGMGITSSNFNDPEFTITGANDGYIFMDAPVGTTGHGNLILATGGRGTENKIVFAAGGLSSDNTQMEITPDVSVHIEIPTPSTSPSTGALTVVGGVGIQGDVNIAGNISFGGSGSQTGVQNLSVAFPIVFVGDGNTGDAIDLGLVGEYVSSGVKYAGIVRDATDGVFKFFRGASTAPTNTVDFGQAGLTYATIKVGGAEIGSVTNTEIGYLSGVTSAIQTQLNNKASASGANLVNTVLTSSFESVTISGTAVTGTLPLDLSTSTVYYYTSNAAGNQTLNFRGNSGTSLNSTLSVGQSVTVAYLTTNGGTAYYPSSLQVDGTTVGVSTKWQGGTAPAGGNTNGVDSYSFTIIKTANATFTILASQIKFA